MGEIAGEMGKGEKRGTGMRLVEIVEEEIIRAEKIKAEKIKAEII